MCNGMSSKECIFTGKKVLPNLNVQWNVFKRVYFYWEKGTPQFECAMECLQRSVFLQGKKYSPIQNRTDLRGILFSMWE